MRVAALVLVKYDVPDDSMLAAYGTTDKNDVLEQERALLEGEDGQGDYLISMLENAEVRIVVVDESVYPEGEVEK